MLSSEFESTRLLDQSETNHHNYIHLNHQELNMMNTMAVFRNQHEHQYIGIDKVKQPMIQVSYALSSFYLHTEYYYPKDRIEYIKSQNIRMQMYQSINQITPPDQNSGIVIRNVQANAVVCSTPDLTPTSIPIDVIVHPELISAGIIPNVALSSRASFDPVHINQSGNFGYRRLPCLEEPTGGMTISSTFVMGVQNSTSRTTIGF